MSKNLKKQSVTLVPSFDFEGWKSMQVYRDLVYNGLHRDKEFNAEVKLIDWPEIENPNKLKRFKAKYMFAPSAVKRIESDIVHHLDHGYAHLINTKQKNVVTVHDLTHYVAPELRGYSLWSWRRRMQKLRLADELVSVTSNVADLLMRYLNIPSKKITVGLHEINAKNFLDINKEEAIKKHRFYSEHDFVICSVGTVDPKKNLGVLLDAVEYMHNEGLPVKLVRIGELFKNGSASWSEKADRLSELGILKEHGFIEHSIVGQIMASSDVFVFPSLYEGFGMPIMEAQALALPLIIAEASCLPEVAGEGALKFLPHDVSGLVSTLKKVMDRTNEATEAVEQGSMNITRYKPGNHIQVLKHVYDKLK